MSKKLEQADPFGWTQWRYGVQWGPVDVVRLMSDAKFGVVMELRTKRQRVEVQVRPGGKIVVGKVKPLGKARRLVETGP